ncbi:MAG: hypothetical protein IIU43_10950, partial [Thermoguttaceae bacterium]|nr:hypothetical protein [Thermoguttaceae bacterium]
TIDRILDDWKAKGRPRHLNICQNDGLGLHCRCDGCLAMDAPLSPSEPFGELFKGEQGAGQTAPAEGGAMSFGVSPEAAKYMPNPADDPNSEDARLQRVGIEPQKTYRDDYDPEIFNDRYHPKN